MSLTARGTHWGTNTYGLDPAVNFSSSIDPVANTKVPQSRIRPVQSSLEGWEEPKTSSPATLYLQTSRRARAACCARRLPATGLDRPREGLGTTPSCPRRCRLALRLRGWALP